MKNTSSHLYHYNTITVSSSLHLTFPSAICLALERSMNGIAHSTRLCRSRLLSRSPHIRTAFINAPSISSTLQKQWTSSQSCSKKSPCQKSAPLSATSAAFWSSRTTWNRASVNTLRCLVGCTLGDFTAMWLLQAYYPDLSMGVVMPISSKKDVVHSLLRLSNKHSGFWHL